MAREIRLIRSLADEGYQFGLNDGVPPIPRDRMVHVREPARHIASGLMDEIEAGGIPVLMLRGEGDEPRRRARLRPVRAAVGRGPRRGASCAARETG